MDQVSAVAEYGTWVAYYGGARVALSLGLLVGAGLVMLAGSRIRRARPIRRPGPAGRGVLVALWVFALIAFVVGISAYARQESRDYPQMKAPPTPIAPVTIGAAVIVAILIFAGTAGSTRERVTNGAVGAVIAPMIFELPFDLIIMSRTYPPVTPDPALYRAVFFAPLFLVELTTMSLLVFSPTARLSRASVQAFALMLAVFAGWALDGFGFPSTPGRFAFNVVSKLLAFTAAAGLFFPHWPRSALSIVRRRVSSSRNPAGSGAQRQNDEQSAAF